MTDFTQPFTLVASSPSATIAVNAIGTVAANAAFIVSGSMTGYTVPPSLQYTDDGGTQNAIGTSSVTATTFNFSHPGVAAGSHTIVVSQVSNTVINGSASYTAQGSAIPPVSNIVLLSATKNLLNLDFTPPDSGGYNYNVHLGTTGLSGPFPILRDGLIRLQIGGNGVFVTQLIPRTTYYVQITAVSTTSGQVSLPATAGPYTTLGNVFTINAITAKAGSAFQVSGTIA